MDAAVQHLQPVYNILQSRSIFLVGIFLKALFCNALSVVGKAEYECIGRSFVLQPYVFGMCMLQRIVFQLLYNALDAQCFVLVHLGQGGSIVVHGNGAAGGKHIEERAQSLHQPQVLQHGRLQAARHFAYSVYRVFYQFVRLLKGFAALPVFLCLMHIQLYSCLLYTSRCV